MFDTLGLLRQEGKIGGFGWSTDHRGRLAAYAPREGFVAVENDFNVFTPANELMAVAARENLVSFSRLPLAMGLLTGKYTPAMRLPTNDVRGGNAEWMVFFRDAPPTRTICQGSRQSATCSPRADARLRKARSAGYSPSRQSPCRFPASRGPSRSRTISVRWKRAAAGNGDGRDRRSAENCRDCVGCGESGIRIGDNATNFDLSDVCRYRIFLSQASVAQLNTDGAADTLELKVRRSGFQIKE
ncbi:aldo/keto reductase [Mesorhizobium sp. M0816]